MSYEVNEFTFKDEDGIWEWCTWDSPQDVLKFLKGRDHRTATVVHRKLVITDWMPE